MKSVKVRAIYRSTRVKGFSAPYDTLSIKLYYPASYGDTFEERNTGVVPADSKRAPFPLVVILPGINLPFEAYSWLAHKMAEAGFAVACYSWITMEIGDAISISPGVELKRLTPKKYGKKPSCPALEALLSEMNRVNSRGPLKGALDLDRVILGGHSAGGTMALINANRDFFPQVRGAFSYAAHTAANSQLGWDKDAMMPLAKDLPLLIMGGTRDGVIAASAHRYGDDGPSSPTERIERTYQEAIKGKRGDRYLLLVEGANHFSMAWPQDTSTGRPFLDKKPRGGRKKIRKLLAKAVVSFCDSVFNGDAMSAAELQGLSSSKNPLVAKAEYK